MNRINESIKKILIKHSLFLLFLRSYIPIISIMLVFSLFSYFLAIRQISNNVQKLNLSLMENISSGLDERLIEMERTSHRINSFGTTAKMAYMEEDNEGFYYEMTGYVQNLWNLWLENDKLTPKMYIYFARTGIIAAPDTFYNADDFYGRFFSYGKMTSQEFYGMLLEGGNNFKYLPSEEVVLQDQNELNGKFDMVIYNYQLKKYSNSAPPGAIFFLIDTREIEKMLQVLEIGSDGLAAIVNSDGKIIAKLDKSSQISDEEIIKAANGDSRLFKDQMILSSLSDKNGWKYIALGSKDVLMKPVIQLRQALAILFIASVLLSFLFSLWMARKRSSPLYELVCRLNMGKYPEIEKPNESGTGYKTLEYGITSVLTQNVTMQEEIAAIQPMLLPAYLHRLFGGGFANDDQAFSAAQPLCVYIPKGPYRLISILVVKQSDLELDVQDDVLQSMLAGSALRLCLKNLGITDPLIYQMNIDETIWIYNGSDQQTDETGLLELLDKLVYWMKEHQLLVSIKFSRLYTSFANSWWEYKRINHTISGSGLLDNKGSNIEMVWQDPDQNHSQYMMLVVPILNTTYRAGDERMLSRLLDIVKKEIFETAQFDPDSRADIINQLIDSADAIIGYQIDRNKYDGRSQEAAFDDFKIEMLYACHNSIISRNESGSFLIRKIREFTDSQIYNPMLSMSMIADKLNISENYLSRIFKEQHGDTLANYIESKRIQTSQDLLLNTMMSISDIALKVGYNSDHVFRRAFRRVTNLSPIEYRQGINSAPGDK